MSRRRYSGYRYEDVLVFLAQHTPLLFENSKGRVCELQFDGVFTFSRSVRVRYQEKVYQAVVLARSSDWYHYSLNCTDRWKHHVNAVIAWTHDSCLSVPVFSLEERRVYGPKIAADVEDFTDETQFPEPLRKTAFGHHMLVGALMCLRPDAQARLATLKPSTQRRIRAEVRRLGMRRRGGPLHVP
ncbi:MAG TPA: hypothetical protein VKX46_01975 [Ktedonobacteraceae bacterium]|jgi:hypothetical protein|nr:hypothetical protein [Ktedonobacteraceae bacterium]